jgi:hypothetical protein
MTWSLRLQNGDLTLGNASYGTVTSEEKLVQDLRCYILEQMGTDDMHPNFGSLLDGGYRSDGSSVKSLIGTPNDAFTQLGVETELRRIIADYQDRQLRRAKDDRIVFGKTTLTKGEVLLAVDEMRVEPTEDKLIVTLTLQTASNTTVELGLEL